MFLGVGDQSDLEKPIGRQGDDLGLTCKRELHSAAVCRRDRLGQSMVM